MGTIFTPKPQAERPCVLRHTTWTHKHSPNFAVTDRNGNVNHQSKHWMANPIQAPILGFPKQYEISDIRPTNGRLKIKRVYAEDLGGEPFGGMELVATGAEGVFIALDDGDAFGEAAAGTPAEKKSNRIHFELARVSSLHTHNCKNHDHVILEIKIGDASSHGLSLFDHKDGNALIRKWAFFIGNEQQKRSREAKEAEDARLLAASLLGALDTATVRSSNDAADGGPPPPASAPSSPEKSIIETEFHAAQDGKGPQQTAEQPVIESTTPTAAAAKPSGQATATPGIVAHSRPVSAINLVGPVAPRRKAGGRITAYTRPFKATVEAERAYAQGDVGRNMEREKEREKELEMERVEGEKEKEETEKGEDAKGTSAPSTTKGAGTVKDPVVIADD